MLAEPRPPPGPRPNETPAAPPQRAFPRLSRSSTIHGGLRSSVPKQLRRQGEPPFQFRQEETDLDEVDLGRKIRRDFEADFLLADCGLRPGLHGVCPPVDRGNETSPPVH